MSWWRRSWSYAIACLNNIPIKIIDSYTKNVMKFLTLSYVPVFDNMFMRHGSSNNVILIWLRRNCWVIELLLSSSSPKESHNKIYDLIQKGKQQGVRRRSRPLVAITPKHESETNLDHVTYDARPLWNSWIPQRSCVIGHMISIKMCSRFEVTLNLV